MAKIESFLFYSFAVILIILLTSNEEKFVFAQESYVSTDYWTPILASMPTAIMGALNLVLVSRLSSNNRGLGLSEKMSRFFPSFGGNGCCGENNNKKSMIFLGKHNIQVSNHDTKGDGEEDEETEEDEEEGEEEEEENENEKDEENENEKYSYKNRKNDKYSDNNVDKDNDKQKYNKKKKQKDDYNSGDGNSGYGSYGENNEYYSDSKDEFEDYKSTLVKDALAQQYPMLDPSQVYLPQSDESIITNIKSDTKFDSKPKLIVEFPQKFSKSNAFLPLFTHNYLPVISDSRAEDIQIKQIYDKPDVQTLSINQFDEPINENGVNSEPVEKYFSSDTIKQINKNYKKYDYISSEPKVNKRSVRSIYSRNRRSAQIEMDRNKVGNVLQIRHNKTQEVKGNKLNIEMIKLLLSMTNKSPKIYKKIDNKYEKSFKESNKKKEKKYLINNPLKSDLKPKSSSKRFMSTKSLIKESSAQPIRYMPINEYKNILNYSADRKSDKIEKRKKKKDKYEDEEDYEEEEEEDDEEDEENEDRGGNNEKHTTIQVIHEPDEKFNIGKGSWMKKIFGFGGRKHRGVLGKIVSDHF